MQELAHDKYRPLLRHVTHLCSTRNRNFKSVFYFIRRVKTLPFQTTFGRLISLNFFWRKKFQDKADKWSFLFSLDFMLKGKRDGVNLWREENSHVSSRFFTIVILERCDIFFDTTFGTRKVKILTRLLSSQVTHRNKRASSFTFVDVRDAVFLYRQSSLQSKWLNKLFSLNKETY